jgi:ABC-type polysaccharide/polyol phosphate transport system ATPase subunit
MQDVDQIISVEGTGKLYTLYDRPEDRLKHALLWRFGKVYGKPFWALKDVSFEIQRGEKFGIIGRNGSGKSTLLQILAGILVPTEGSVDIRGRVAALLELGSGFNPEFTGRENIFFNGAILGASRQELEENLDRIIAFADIGQFIDQPVKTYSSGMFVRLAFAVASGVEADILLIDEALAVGDVFFRQKCYQRLDELHAKGTTVVLVSHAMNEVEQFCDRAIILHEGQMTFKGSAVEAVKRYYLISQPSSAEAAMPKDLYPPAAKAEEYSETGFGWPGEDAYLSLANVIQITNDKARLIKVAVTDEDMKPCTAFEQGETASFFYEFEVDDFLPVAIGGMQLQNERGVIVHGKTGLEYGEGELYNVPPNSHIKFRQDVQLNLAKGEYTFEVGLVALRREVFDRRDAMDNDDLFPNLVRYCAATGNGPIAVISRKHGKPVQLLHHGVCDLPGKLYASIKP